jgi:uncharacterized protein (UPF0332 family)
MQQAHTYQERSREYLSKAFQELEAGDLTQASEKGWGAAAQMVKAVAHDKGMEHHSHRSLLFAAQDIEKNNGGATATQFAFAEQLHRNFYEDTLDRAGVTMRLEQVASFVDSLDRLLPT